MVTTPGTSVTTLPGTSTSTGAGEPTTGGTAVDSDDTSAVTSEGLPTSTSTGGGAKFDVGTMADASGPCEEIEVTPMPQRPNVALVLDYSSSMQSFLGNKTRWAVLWEAVDFLISGWDPQLNLGMMLFPDLDISMSESNSCVTEDFEVPVAPMNGANILAVLPGPDHDPPGNTPTRSGVLVAAAHLETLDPATPRAIFLVTDGDALCGPDQWEELTDDGVDEVIGEIYSVRGIPTYVIGLAAQGSDFIAHLNEMGVAGGRPNPAPGSDYYAGDDQASLQAAFEQVVIDVITCTLDLEEAPSDATLFKVSVDGVEYAFVPDCAQGDGWTFVPDTMNKQIELCGAACAAFKGGASFHAKQYCLNG
ncbi:vWA domain-containing protein [Nannocystis radixulma]|nr:vWA domain-containing protein [Nannocystis radixulma]